MNQQNSNPSQKEVEQSEEEAAKAFARRNFIYTDDFVGYNKDLYTGFLAGCQHVRQQLSKEQVVVEKQRIIDAYTDGQKGILEILFTELAKRGFKPNIQLDNDLEDGEEYYNNLITKEHKS